MAGTYNDLYLDARRDLKKAGVEQAQLEARELLELASGKSREQLLRDLPLYASDKVAERFRELMMTTGELVMDVGTVLNGEDAVAEGLIDRLGTLSEAVECLYAMIEEREGSEDAPAHDH